MTQPQKARGVVTQHPQAWPHLSILVAPPDQTSYMCGAVQRTSHNSKCQWQWMTSLSVQSSPATLVIESTNIIGSTQSHWNHSNDWWFYQFPTQNLMNSSVGIQKDTLKRRWIGVSVLNNEIKNTTWLSSGKKTFSVCSSSHHSKYSHTKLINSLPAKSASSKHT
jgi:hypothetical protein